MDRLRRFGNLHGGHHQGSVVIVDSACDGCAGGCWRSHRRDEAAVLELPEHNTPLGPPGAPVAVSVSRSGLTRLSLLLFAPAITTLLLLALAADRGISGWLLLGFGAAGLSLALAISRSAVRTRAQGLLDVDARLIVSG